MLKSTPSRKTCPAWVALGIGLLATVFASLQVKQGIEHDAVRQFAFVCDQVTLKIQERLGAYAMILRGGAALFAASKAVERHEWRAYVEGLQASENVPGVQGIGFNLLIPADQLAAHIARIRSEGFPDYTVRPPGERPLYTPVVYLEPFRNRNLRAFGFDTFSEPVRRAAMEQARDTGLAALSGKVVLVQETAADVQAGVLMYVPVYRNGMPLDNVGQRQAAVLGWVYSPYRMNDLMAGILGDWDSYAGKTVDLHIYAGHEATPATLLFDSKPTATPDVQSLFYRQRTVDFNGRSWLLVFDRTPTVPVIGYVPAWAALAGGLALSGMLFGLMLAVINTRVNAARIAEELTDKIKRREALLQESEAFKLAILNAVPAEIAVVDRDGVILAVNDPWRRFALENGIEPGKPAPHTAVGDNYLAACQLETSFAADDGAANISEGIRAVLEDGLPSFSLEYPCHSTTQKFWFTMTVTPMGCDAGGKVVITHTDISGRKLLEEAREEALGRLQKIASSVPGVVYQFRLRPDGSACFPFASEAIREIYRVSPEEVREDASKVFAILHPDDFDGVVAYIRQSAQDLTPWRHEYRVKFDDGTVHWLSGNALPEREADGATLWHGFITDITGRKQAEAIFHAVFDQSSFLAGILDRQGRLVEVNSTALSFTDTPREAVIGQYFPDTPWWDNGEDRDKLIEVLNLAYTGTAASFEATHAVPAGGRINVMFSTMPIIMENGIHLAVFGMDVTQRKQAEDQLHLAASVFTHAWEGIMITAADGTIIDVNDAFSRITSYSHDEVLGQNPRILSSGSQEEEFYTEMWRVLVEQGQWYGEMWNRRRDGEVYAVMQTISAVRDAQGNTKNYVALFSDITLLKDHEHELEHIAHYDALTSLPNRVLLADRLNQGMIRAQRRGQQGLAVAFLDLDGFKAINDNHGHDAGDQLLITVASLMKLALREGDTLARIGGDEFVAVLLDLADVTASTPLLDRLLAAAAQPVQFGGLALQVSASLGVTFYPQAEDIDADQLLRQADQAMYQAKLAGKNRYHLFDAEQDRNVRSLYESLERIRRALLDREFVLHYQPKVNLRTGAVIGAEALIRWQHPERGMLPPTAFLPVIENHPLAVELGEWVIDTALAQVERWQADGLDLPVSVNVGARQLQQADFVERLRGLLAAHPNTMPGHLELEVLETNTLELAGASQVIEACRGIGVLFALDDFGTGYSSMTYLKRLPVARIKIDQSFVRDMLDDPDDLAILEGVLGLAAAFHRQVVAEGVETVEHGEMLLQLGCELAQGYGIARPMPAADLPSWAARWRPAPAWVDLLAVSRNDLPLLFAGAEHRAWIAALESHLKGGRETPPPLVDPRQCRFGKWLDAGGLARHDAKPAFQGIDPLHRQVHALAAGLAGLQSQGRGPEARAMLGELHGMRDALLGQLQALVREIRR